MPVIVSCIHIHIILSFLLTSPILPTLSYSILTTYTYRSAILNREYAYPWGYVRDSLGVREKNLRNGGQKQKQILTAYQWSLESKKVLNFDLKCTRYSLLGWRGFVRSNPGTQGVRGRTKVENRCCRLPIHYN
jgi:hypothetical protein